VVETEACRKLSLTVVNSVPRAKARVVWVCLIQCGLALRNFSAVFGDSASMASAVVMKKRLVTSHNRLEVMQLLPPPLFKSAMSGVDGFHMAGIRSWYTSLHQVVIQRDCP